MPLRQLIESADRIALKQSLWESELASKKSAKLWDPHLVAYARPLRSRHEFDHAVDTILEEFLGRPITQTAWEIVFFPPDESGQIVEARRKGEQVEIEHLLFVLVDAPVVVFPQSTVGGRQRILVELVYRFMHAHIPPILTLDALKKCRKLDGSYAGGYGLHRDLAALIGDTHEL